MSILSHLAKCRKLISGVAAIGLATGLAVAAALPAQAGTGINPNQKGSLTIHKYEQPAQATSLPNDGTEVDPNALAAKGLVPIKDVTYSVEQVETAPGTPLNLATNDAWQKVEALAKKFNAQPDEATVTGEGYSLKTVGQEKTDSAGEVEFKQLSVGLYLVKEVSAPAHVKKAAPFMITLPVSVNTPDNNGAPQDDTWLYDVHAYPKNQLRADSLTIDDNAAPHLGKTVMLQVKAEIQAGTIDHFVIKDTLDPRMSLIKSEAVLEGPKAGKLINNKDYVFSQSTAANGATDLTIDFQSGQMATNLEQNTGGWIKWDISAKVDSVGDGIIPNTALIYPNDASTGLQPGDADGPNKLTAETRYGGVEVAKTDPTGKPLQGARFVVVATKAGEAAPTSAKNAVLIPAAEAGKNAVVEGNATVWESDATGHLTINGLRLSCFSNGAAVANCPAASQPDTAVGGSAAFQYWLVEIKAPKGYSLLAEPVKFVVQGLPKTSGADLTIQNVPVNGGFQLPLTGGTGTALFVLGGLMLAGLALWLVVAYRRRQAAESQS